MANNYLQFSTVINNLTPEEHKWLEEITTKVESLPDECSDIDIFDAAHLLFYDDGQKDIPFEYDLGADYFHLYASEGGNVNSTAEFISLFYKNFRPIETKVFSWAETCSKMRADEFGGGECLITADWIFWPPKNLHDIAAVYVENKKKGNVFDSSEIVVTYFTKTN